MNVQFRENLNYSQKKNLLNKLTSTDIFCNKNKNKIIIPCIILFILFTIITIYSLRNFNSDLLILLIISMIFQFISLFTMITTMIFTANSPPYSPDNRAEFYDV
jgi:hypothetical protein